MCSSFEGTAAASDRQESLSSLTDATVRSATGTELARGVGIPREREREPFAGRLGVAAATGRVRAAPAGRQRERLRAAN